MSYDYPDQYPDPCHDDHPDQYPETFHDDHSDQFYDYCPDPDPFEKHYFNPAVAFKSGKIGSSEEFNCSSMDAFSGFCKLWLLLYSGDIPSSHYVEVEQVVNTYILPAFGKLPVSLIDNDEIMKFHNKLKKQVLFPLQIVRIMALLKSILDTVADYYDIQRNDFGDTIDPVLNLAMLAAAREVVAR